MCKAPVAGRVKTRLRSRFSSAQACELHAAMAASVIEQTGALFDNLVIAADDIEHPFFLRFGLPIVPQGEGDLGQRMQRQVKRALNGGAGGVLLIGTDAPHMLLSRLQSGAAALDDHDVVLGPVEDGGYDLIGLRSDYPLFDGVAWSTNCVLAQTLVCIKEQQLSHYLLETGFDIDFPEDLERAIACGWTPEHYPQL